MLVQFETDHEGSSPGFSAKIYYTPINSICKDWLNITSGFLTSPNHPTIDCSWVITASMSSTIPIQFYFFEVKLKINVKLKNIYICSYIICRSIPRLG